MAFLPTFTTQSQPLYMIAVLAHGHQTARPLSSWQRCPDTAVTTSLKSSWSQPPLAPGRVGMESTGGHHQPRLPWKGADETSSVAKRCV